MENKLLVFLCYSLCFTTIAKNGAKIPNSTSTETFRPEEDKLLSWLFDKCSLGSEARPVKSYNETLEVFFFFYPMRFIGLAERDQVLTFITGLDLRWIHPCAKWSDLQGTSNPWANIHNTHVKASQVWRPHINHLTAVDENVAELIDDDTTLVNIKNNGELRWTAVGRFQTSCGLSLKRFPFDKQTCHLRFISATHMPLIYLQLESTGGIYSADVLNTMDTEFISKSEIWHLDATSATAFNTTFPGFEKYVFNQIHLSLTFSRKSSHYITSIIIPNVMLMILQLGFIILPPWMGERPAYSATIVMAFFILQSVVQSDIPKTSETIYIVLYICAQTLLSMLCTLYALASCALSAEPKGPLPKRRFLFWRIRTTKFRMYDMVFFVVILLSIASINGYTFVMMLT